MHFKIPLFLYQIGGALSIAWPLSQSSAIQHLEPAFQIDPGLSNSARRGPSLPIKYWCELYKRTSEGTYNIDSTNLPLINRLL